MTFSLFWVSHVDIIRTSYPAALASVAGRILLLYFYTFARMAMADILMDLVFPAIVYFFPLLPVSSMPMSHTWLLPKPCLSPG